jgi:hypothetical protein
MVDQVVIAQVAQVASHHLALAMVLLHPLIVAVEAEAVPLPPPRQVPQGEMAPLGLS